MLPKAFEAAYKKAFWEADEPSKKRTKYVLAMVDPNLGDAWWK